MASMRKRTGNWFEAAENAVLGYAVVVLSLLCFLLFLLSIVVAVRFFAG